MNTPKFALFLDQIKTNAEMPGPLKEAIMNMVGAKAAQQKLVQRLERERDPMAMLAAAMMGDMLEQHMLTCHIALLQQLHMPQELNKFANEVIRALGPLQADTSVPEWSDIEVIQAKASDRLSPLFAISAVQAPSTVQ